MTKPQFLLFVAAAMLLAACGAPAAQPSTNLTVLETEFAYSPASITVPIGEPVTLAFENDGALEHDFVIEHIVVEDMTSEDAGEQSGHDMNAMEQYDVHISTLPGETSTLTFTATEPGTYEFLCTVAGHKEAGMIGKLTVVGQ